MLSTIQQQVYEYIVQFICREGYSPTRGEIAHHFGWTSANSAEEHVKRLVSSGYLRLDSRRWGRNLKLVPARKAVAGDFGF